MSDVQWSGVDDMVARMQRYAQAVEYALWAVATKYQAIFESYAKENRPWDDRTSAAVDTLHAWVDKLSNDTVALYLSHGVEYGVFLETRFGGQFSIIWPTIQHHLDDITKMLKEIFG